MARSESLSFSRLGSFCCHRRARTLPPGEDKPAWVESPPPAEQLEATEPIGSDTLLPSADASSSGGSQARVKGSRQRSSSVVLGTMKFAAMVIMVMLLGNSQS